MTDTIKKNSPIILAEIKRAKNILLHCHPSPDPDSVGSVLAMKLVLEQMGKKVTAIRGDSEIPKAFVFPAVETIVQKSYHEVNPEDFDLFIILDSGSIEMISSKKIIFPESMMTMVIDHHASNRGYGKINLINSKYGATAELLFDLFREMKIKLNHDIALNLFMGIYTDTGGFRYMNTTVNTFKVATELVALAPDFTKTIFIMENSNRKENLIYQGIALSSLKEFCNGRLVISFVTYEQLKKNNIKEEDYSGIKISNILKSVIGFDITVNIIEYEPNMIKVGFRTRDEEKYDVSKIAVALDGGGHKAAAGARLSMTMTDAIETVVKKAKEIYNL